jgi:hypothetical protein
LQPAHGAPFTVVVFRVEQQQPQRFVRNVGEVNRARSSVNRCRMMTAASAIESAFKSRVLHGRPRNALSVGSVIPPQPVG